ncbi:GAF and ANTAR domain-containing protein [Ruania suaedae]|uniref:GAF and ANTAR domain-containing protein n=1 Tax=Ruania suaedae TaxID=2897774 RepID=UPI001E41583F|nr:GAF and ANTAR domain-containing protein [Ruania suaedae]UFU02236.1 GAF and ANTAR domain-containing protein [Ruania suaedae]
MYDEQKFVQLTAAFTEKLVAPYDVDEALRTLAENLTDLLALAGSGVTLGLEERLRAATAVPPHLAALEHYQEQHQEGPCVSAYHTGEVVAVSDLREETRWPGYRTIAADVGVRAVAGMPMKLAGNAVGALNMYHAEPHIWDDSDLLAARALSNMATAYLIHSSTLSQQNQLSDQLQHALDSRVLIEQAKGVLTQTHALTLTEAYELLRRNARNNGRKVREVADDVVEGRLQL